MSRSRGKPRSLWKPQGGHPAPSGGPWGGGPWGTDADWDWGLSRSLPAQELGRRPPWWGHSSAWGQQTPLRSRLEHTNFRDEKQALSEQRPREACSRNVNSLKKSRRFHVDTEELVALDPHALKTARGQSGCCPSLVGSPSGPGRLPWQGRQPGAGYCPSHSGTSSAVPSLYQKEVSGGQAEKLGASHSARRSRPCCLAARCPLFSTNWRGSPPSRTLRLGLSYSGALEMDGFPGTSFYPAFTRGLSPGLICPRNRLQQRSRASPPFLNCFSPTAQGKRLRPTKG